MLNKFRKGYVLVVDDDPYVRESAEFLLKENEYSTLSCDSAEQAVRILLENDISLTLTDIKMPGMSGIDLLEKATDLKPKMPVILMTGYAELELAIAAVKKGAFDFVTKPYDPDYLIDRIDKAMRYVELLNVEEDYKHRLEETVKRQTQEIFNLSREVIMRLTSVAEFRDVETGAHISRIGLYANKIAEHLNMPSYFVESMTYSSSLHDIGKIGIPDNILLKPGAFTKEEFEIMKSHTTIGHNILAESKNAVLQLASSIALNHHERYDGTGYPRGLKGDAIPLEGRIVIICDQYDALMSVRPYKPALEHKQAVKILTEGDGRTMPHHFDPKVLEAFLKLEPTFHAVFKQHQD